MGIIKADNFTRYNYGKQLNNSVVVPAMVRAEQREIADQINTCGDFVYAIDCCNCHTKHFAGFSSCRSRWCISCSHKKVLCWLAKLMPIIEKWPGNVTMLNFTIVDTESLREGLDILYNGWRSFSNSGGYRKMFRERFPGGVRSLEVKLGKGSNIWHPHLHCYCLQPKEYKKDYEWIKNRWVEITGGSVYLKSIKGDRIAGLVEVIKYILKPETGFYSVPDRLREAVENLKGCRQINTWGTLRGVGKEVEVLFDTWEEKKLTEFLCQRCGFTEGQLRKLVYGLMSDDFVLYDVANKPGSMSSIRHNLYPSK